MGNVTVLQVGTLVVPMLVWYARITMNVPVPVQMVSLPCMPATKTLHVRTTTDHISATVISVGTQPLMEQTPNVSTLMNVSLHHLMMPHQGTHVMPTLPVLIMMEVTSVTVFQDGNPTQLTPIPSVSMLTNVPNQPTIPKWKAVQLTLHALILMVPMNATVTQDGKMLTVTWTPKLPVKISTNVLRSTKTVLPCSNVTIYQHVLI